MTKKEFKKQVNELPVEKRKEVAQLLQKSHRAIMDVEDALLGTSLINPTLCEFNEGFTLWHKIYNLWKLFDFENDKR